MKLRPVRGYSIRLPDEASGFPFSVPSIQRSPQGEFGAAVTFLVGENGSGKSTLLEALAIAAGLPVAGGADTKQDATLDGVRPLARAMKLSWGLRTGQGFFLRAEDFFNFSRRLRSMEEELGGLAEKYQGTHAYGYLKAQEAAVHKPYGGDLDHRSHGESFLDFFKARIHGRGLYLIDEPEAALSPQRQFAFATMLLEESRRGCQFIVASHSPIILSLPGAEIWEFGDDGIVARPFADLEHVRFSRQFLESPERFWRHLCSDPG